VRRDAKRIVGAARGGEFLDGVRDVERVATITNARVSRQYASSIVGPSAVARSHVHRSWGNACRIVAMAESSHALVRAVAIAPHHAAGVWTPPR
jgi:hypothetical protein